MTLRARLLLGYGYLVALLLVVAGSAALGFLGLSAGIEVVLDENFESIRAAMTMTEALERQDSAILALLIEGRLGAAEGAAASLAEQEEVFRQALERAAGNVTEVDEPAVLERIRDRYEAFRQARDELVAESPERPLAAYNREVFPRFSQVKQDVRLLLTINQRAMIEADREAREAAIQSGTWLGFLVVIALVSLVFLSRALQRQILARLEELRTGVGSIAAGKHRRLREMGSDELGLIARNVNGLLDRYEELECRTRGRVSQERRLVLGLLGAAGDGAVLYDLSGSRLAGDAELGAADDEITAWIRTDGRKLAASAVPVRREIEVDDHRAELELLIAPGDRPAGWLARVG